MKQQEVVDGSRYETQRLIEYLEALPADAWEKPTLCGAWRVRDLVSHLVGNVADVLVMNLTDAGSETFNQRQVDERADRSPAELLAEWNEKGPQMAAMGESLPADLWDSELPGFNFTMGFGAQRLLEDLWVHAQDIRIPLGDEPLRDGPGLVATLEVIAWELGQRVPELAPGVASVRLEAGQFSETVRTADSGAEITVSGDPVALALVGTGRRSLDEAVADGSLKLNVEPPAGFAQALNIYAA